MSTESTQLPLPLPEVIRPWLTLNAEFYVLICHHASCQQALSPGAISSHLRDKHLVKIELRRQIDEYLKQWQWPYDFQSVPLPLPGLASQPILPVLDGFHCQDCDYMTRNRSNIRKC